MKEWREIIAFNDKYFPNWRETVEVYYSNALAGETGEVCNLIKKMIGGGTNKKTVTPHEVALECVDVYIYLVLLLEKLGLDDDLFASVFIEKMQTNILRMEAKK